MPQADIGTCEPREIPREKMRCCALEVQRVGNSRSPPILPFPIHICILWTVHLLDPLLPLLPTPTFSLRNLDIMIHCGQHEVANFYFSTFALYTCIHCREFGYKTVQWRLSKIAGQGTDDRRWERKCCGCGGIDARFLRIVRKYLK